MKEIRAKIFVVEGFFKWQKYNEGGGARPDNSLEGPELGYKKRILQVFSPPEKSRRAGENAHINNLNLTKISLNNLTLRNILYSFHINNRINKMTEYNKVQKYTQQFDIIKNYNGNQELMR